MAEDCRSLSGQWPARRAVDRPPHRCARHLLDSQQWCALAGPARTLRGISDGAPTPVALATRWHLGTGAEKPANAGGCKRSDQLGAVERRHHQRPRHPACRWSAEKKGLMLMSLKTMVWAYVAAVLAANCMS